VHWLTNRFELDLELSNSPFQGQKIKLVIAACLWNNPQVCTRVLSLRLVVECQTPCDRFVFLTSRATFWIVRLSAAWLWPFAIGQALLYVTHLVHVSKQLTTRLAR
jgi:hypothetical protein